MDADLDSTNQMNEKVLCLVRGDPVVIGRKIGGKKDEVAEFSAQMHQENGVHIESLGKFVIAYGDFLAIQHAYQGKQVGDNSNLGIDSFYLNLEKFLVKTDPMGLLIWENPYSVSTLDMQPISSLPYPPYKIIIAPPSRSLTDPEF